MKNSVFHGITLPSLNSRHRRRVGMDKEETRDDRREKKRDGHALLTSFSVRAKAHICHSAVGG